jgi:hypothetical protein
MSDYSRERYFERTGNIGNVAISPDLTRSLRAQGVDFATIKDEVIKLIVSELETRLESILTRKFSGRTFAIPVLAVKLWAGDSSDFVKIYTKSNVYKKDRDQKYVRDETGQLIPTGEKVYIGEKFYLPIVNDYIETMMLYPATKSDKEIADSMEEHGYRKNKGSVVTVMPLGDQDIFNIEVLEDGTVQEKKFGSTEGYVDYTIEQQWAVSKGRKLKVSVMLPTIDTEKSTDKNLVYVTDLATGKPVTSLETVEATIEELIQPAVTAINTAGKKSKVIWSGPEKLIKLKLNVGRPIPVVKTIKPDDTIWLPIGEGGEMIKCKVLTPTYVLDERSANPVNIRFKAIK